MHRLTRVEYEHLVDEMEILGFDMILTPEWNRQRETLFKLSKESHRLSIAEESDYLLPMVQVAGKLPVLLTELFIIEIWKSQVGQLLRPELVQLGRSSLRPYFLNYHELTVCSLLELWFFEKDTILADEVLDLLPDLVDYIHRKITLLTIWKDNPEDEILPSPDPEGTDEEVQYEKQLRKIEFGCCMHALSMLRYLTDNLQELPPNVVDRLLNKHDSVVAMVYLIERAPWKRRHEGKWFKYEGNQWVQVKGRVGMLKMNIYEAQAWLAMNNLLMDREAQRKYEFNAFRKETVLRLSKFIHSEHLVDQIPPLVDLQKYVAQLQIVNPPVVNPQTFLLIEQAGMIRERILEVVDFEEIARKHRDILLSESPEDRMREAQRYAEMFEDLEFTEQQSRKKGIIQL